MKTILQIIFTILLFLLLSFAINGEEMQGYIGFEIELKSSLHNGYNDSMYEESLFELENLANCKIMRNYSGVIIKYTWLQETEHKGFTIFLTQLKKATRYYIQYTWDAINAKSDLYVNGALIRTENEKFFHPWHINSIDSIKAVNKSNLIQNIEIENKFCSPLKVKGRVPVKLINNDLDLFMFINQDNYQFAENLKGDLIYSSDLSDQRDVENWKMEGPGRVSFSNNEMIMESEIPNPDDGFTGHFNFWCPQEFPDSIILEWEFAPISDHGVCHFFFSATGEHGEDISDSSLVKRDGHYSQYHSGDINNYFVIYFSNWGFLRTTNFATASLHKSKPYAFLSHGKTAVEPGKNKFNKLQLVKKHDNIILYANGMKCLYYTHEEGRYGKIYEKGKIGFRQMAETKARYRNLKIYAIKAECFK